MKILVAGGGSGGHVTPVVAVVREIWAKHPRAKIEFWTDKKYYTNVRKIAVDGGLNLRVRKVASGKLRRYAHFKFVDYLKNFDIVLTNLVDFLKIFVGFCQSFWRLWRLKPDVIFLKGGYTCLPIGVAARILRIPYILHDSDATPGLTNRVLAGRARRIATGMPTEYYDYPAEKAQWTGIPVAEEFRPVTAAEQKKLKRELGFAASEPLVVVTGGSLGAQTLNFSMREILPDVLSRAGVILVAGRERYNEMLDLKEYEKWEKGRLRSNFLMLEFSAEMYKLFGAADVVVSRAGASTITELANMGKAVILVPNHKLPGRHQVKNADLYVSARACLAVRDDEMTEQPGRLAKAISKLVGDAALRRELAGNLHKFAKMEAAGEIADMIVAEAKAKQ